jgi:hypothetical protein
MVTAIDTETARANDVREPVPRLVSIAAAGDLGRHLLHQSDPAARDLAAAAFDQGITGANLPFDVLVILRRWPELLGNVVAAYTRGDVFDVLTRARLLDIALARWNKKYGLDAVTERATGITVDKSDPWRLRYSELLEIPIVHWPEGARHYAQHDADATHATHEAQDLEARRYNPSPLLTQIVHARAHLALYCQTVIGCRTDQDHVRPIRRQHEAWLEELTRACQSAGLVRTKGKRKITLVATPANARAMVASMCAQRGVAPVPNKSQTAPSVSEEAMRNAGVPGIDDDTADLMSADGRFLGHPLDAYRRRGAIQKLLTGRIAALSRPVVRWRYRELVDSGRTSSTAPNRKKPDQIPWYEWCGLQIQNLPRVGGFRECLVPDPGTVFVIKDIATAELCGLAHFQRLILGRSTLGDALDAGLDPHAKFGMRILGLPVEAYDPKNPEHKSKRQAAKPWNFGKPGGLGAEKFQIFARAQYKVQFELEEIRELDRLWRQEWPEIEDCFRWIEQQGQGRGRARKFSIVHPCTGYVRGGMSYTEACNFVFLQHLVAMIAKEQAWRLWLAQLDPTSPLYQCPQKMFVHDEHVTQVAHGEPVRCPAHTGPSCKRCDYTAERFGPGWIFPRVEAARDEAERIMIESAGAWAPLVRWRVDSHITWRYCKA